MVLDERVEEGREQQIVAASVRNEREPRNRLVQCTWLCKFWWKRIIVMER